MNIQWHKQLVQDIKVKRFTGQLTRAGQKEKNTENHKRAVSCHLMSTMHTYHADRSSKGVIATQGTICIKRLPKNRIRQQGEGRHNWQSN